MRKKQKTTIVGEDALKYFQGKELNRKEKAYLIMRFIILLHKDDRFPVVQKPIDYILNMIYKNELYEVLKEISLTEFIEVARDIFLMKTNLLADTIYDIERHGIPEQMIYYLDKVVENATKKKG